MDVQVPSAICSFRRMFSCRTCADCRCAAMLKPEGPEARKPKITVCDPSRVTGRSVCTMAVTKSNSSAIFSRTGSGLCDWMYSTPSLQA
eukprot:1510552-Amphidinium_carterae.1